MSGFVVIHHPDGAPVDSVTLRGALDAARWRGPDGAGFWLGEGIGMAHCRMETTPEERGVQQPLVSPEGGCRIVWDGRLDYREDLLAALGPSVAPAAPDAAMVLAAYARWGEECVARLEGEFAFVLWDDTRQRLLCARDRFGIRPFHYHWNGRRFVAASETIQHLAAGVSDVPNDWILLVTLAGHYGELEETVYRDIRHLPPAHRLLVERGGLAQRRYWSPDPRHIIQVRDSREAGEGFLALLRGAVRTRMRAIGPVTAHLSGGLDSSSIVCVAAEAQAGPNPPAAELITLSATYRDFAASNEEQYVQAVRDRTGVAYHPIPCDQFCALDPPELPFVDHGEPSLAPLDPFNRVVMQEVDRLGARVLLSGIGGDQVMLTQPEFLTDLLARGRLRRFWQEIGRRPGDRHGLIWNFALRPLLPSALLDFRIDLRTWRRGGDLPPWIRVDARTRWQLMRVQGWVDPLRRFAWRHGARRFRETTHGLTASGALFEALAFPYPIETRYPFLDARLLEYLMALPPEVVGQLGDRRSFHRLALTGVLPDAVRLRRDKGDFTDLYHTGLRKRHTQRVRELLRTPRLQCLPYFDPAGARRWFEEYLQSSNPYAPQPIYGLLALEDWLAARQDHRRRSTHTAGLPAHT